MVVKLVRYCSMRSNVQNRYPTSNFLDKCKICHARIQKVLLVGVERKKEFKDQESIQSNTTPDAGHHMGKSQKHKKTSHTREPTLTILFFGVFS